ncbi:MAG: hypothetical protein M3276_05970 [Actinomycetota bacterium]|nr:hypothetical protein [Actinomycetota bacterium]
MPPYRARKAVATLTLIRLDDALYEVAADLEPPALRSLDAIHLAAALSLGRDLAGVVTYDLRVAEADDTLGLRAETPGRDKRARRRAAKARRPPERQARPDQVSTWFAQRSVRPTDVRGGRTTGT